MPSEHCFEYPTRIRKIVIPTSSNASSLFEIGSLPKLPGRFHPFRIAPSSESLIRDMKSERNLPIPSKSRMIHRMVNKIGESDFDTELDPILMNPWPILDIPRENVEEEVDCDEDVDDYSDEQHELVKQSIPATVGDFLLEVPRVPTLPSDLLELSSLQQPDQTLGMPGVENSAFELAENAVSKVWVNPQYEAILKRKADEESDSVDVKKRKTS